MTSLALADLFRDLKLEDYLDRFQQERYEMQDLARLAADDSDELKQLIPHAGPRGRLVHWLRPQQAPEQMSFEYAIVSYVL